MQDSGLVIVTYVKQRLNYKYYKNDDLHFQLHTKNTGKEKEL
jgi:hypothetical protein